MRPGDDTADLLERWYDGDRAALGKLLRDDAEWMLRQIRQKLTPRLRAKLDSADVIQDCVVKLLQHGPRFVPANRAQFRSLVGQVLLNLVRDQARHHNAERRDLGREERMASAVSGIQDARRSITGPSTAAHRNEVRDWLHLGLELLGTDDRRIITMRHFEERSFDEIAREMGLSSPDVARMRFNRALPRLAKNLEQLENVAREAPMFFD